MGGKGIRRREKNYRAAHGGGYSRLPPPPDYSKADALPSKLRKLLEFTASHGSEDSIKFAKAADKTKKKNGVTVTSAEPKPGDEAEFETGFGDEGNAEHSEHQHTDEKKKKKRKRMQVQDLRFEAEALDQSGGRLKRKERKKKYLEAKKNKKKKKGKTDENMDFPGREEIRFGDVVQAPPKLVVPKALKNVQDPSKERVRVKAIEAYRQRKGWNARPGIQLPPPVTASTAM